MTDDTEARRQRLAKLRAHHKEVEDPAATASATAPAGGFRTGGPRVAPGMARALLKILTTPPEGPHLPGSVVTETGLARLLDLLEERVAGQAKGAVMAGKILEMLRQPGERQAKGVNLDQLDRVLGMLAETPVRGGGLDVDEMRQTIRRLEMAVHGLTKRLGEP
ncbi:MAG: hypothetical protein HQL38_13865 [Alphaproteobacteria bacterium]|nr:hypothetical protein [Alphaproteobacteria bacterium]MBF0393760.1 hypothetical protein [Alphaproteobacteria bacterium]